MFAIAVLLSINEMYNFKKCLDRLCANRNELPRTIE